MQKLTSFLNSRKPSSTIKSLFYFCSSLPETPNLNSVFLIYLIDSFSFPQSQALALSKYYSSIKSLEKPQSVCQFLKNIGFSEAQIQSIVRRSPQILVCDVDRTLKPKIGFLQNHLGVSDSDLVTLISKNSRLLSCSLGKTLIPRIEILKQVLVDDKNNENLIRVLRRSSYWFASVKNSNLLSNIEFFKSCGIVGSQLSNLLTHQSRLFAMPEFEVKELVSKVLDMGFSFDSRMFVYGLHSFSRLSEKTFERKSELLRSFGFSRDEFLEMLKKAPRLPNLSEEKLKSGLEFFLKKVGLEKAALCNTPQCLMYSMENRVIPRYRVFKIVISRRLLKKECIFPSLMFLSEEKFLQKFVWRFKDDAEELLRAYKGQNLGSSSSSSSSSEEES